MRIGQVSEKYDISTDTLRYYERIGLLPFIRRNSNGIREFEDIDIKRIEFIKCMRSAGLSIEVLIKYFQLMEQGDKTTEARKQILLDQREKLVTKMKKYQETLDILDYKIEIYKKAMVKTEKNIFPNDEKRVNE